MALFDRKNSYQFISVEEVKESSLKFFNQNSFFQAEFRLVNKVNKYERTVYNFLEAVGDLGGAWALLISCVGSVV